MRIFLGILVGLVVGFLVAIVVGGIAVAATASGVLPRDASGGLGSQQVMEIFAALPVGAKLGFVLAWFFGVLCGASLAKLIARTSWIVWAVAGPILVYVLLNVMVLPMPAWLQALSVAGPLLAGFLANRLVAGAAARSAPDAGL